MGTRFSNVKVGRAVLSAPGDALDTRDDGWQFPARRGEDTAPYRWDKAVLAPVGAFEQTSLSPQRGERLRVRGGQAERLSRSLSASSFPPLTPALSPLTGEGERNATLGLNRAALRISNIC